MPRRLILLKDDFPANLSDLLYPKNPKIYVKKKCFNGNNPIYSDRHHNIYTNLEIAEYVKIFACFSVFSKAEEMSE